MGKVVVVTGGAKGIGATLRDRLLADGDDVAVLDVLDVVGGDPVAQGAGAGPGDRRVLALACDVADPDAVDAAFARVADELGPVQGLVNNAGVYPRAAVGDIDYRRWLRVVEVNLGGAFNCAKALLRHLPDGERASIVNVSSPIAYEGAPTGSHYAASKAGVLGLTKALAVELAPLVRVNTVVPGVTDTDQVREGGRGPAELAEFAATSVPLRRLCEPADVAELVAFLLSDRAAYITGQAVHVNGGMYLH